MLQYKKKKSWRSFFLTILVLIALIVLSHRNPEASRFSSMAVNTVLNPVQRVFYAGSQVAQDLLEQVFGSKPTRERVQVLEQENQALRMQVEEMRTVIGQQPFLEKEYALMHGDEKNYVSARVSALDSKDTFVRFTVNQGFLAGVQVGDAVLQGVQLDTGSVVEGLIGRVVEVGPNYAKVESILDQANNLSVMIGGQSYYGIINNRDQEEFKGYMLDKTHSIAPGDMVYTSGLGDRYERGLYIGVVVDTQLSDDELTRTFRLRSPIDFSQLYRVLIRRSEKTGVPVLDYQQSESSSVQEHLPQVNTPVESQPAAESNVTPNPAP